MRLSSTIAFRPTLPSIPAKQFEGRVKTKDEIAAKIERMGGYAGISSVLATLAGLNGYLNPEEPAAPYLMGAAAVSGFSTLGLFALSPKMPKEEEKGDIQ